MAATASRWVVLVAVQLTTTREVLANIVRTRYSDPMQFLAGQSLNAQFSVSVRGSAKSARPRM